MLLFTVFLSILISILYFCLLKALSKIKTEQEQKSEEIKISLIIPFKNEEKNLPNLIKSLSLLNYTFDNFEIIFVNDNSTDKSLEIIKNDSTINFKLINVVDKKIPGKKGVLEAGIEQAQFDIIAITDADCIVEKNWLKSISKKILQGYDLVFGYSPIIARKSLISKISSYENLKNFILYFSSVELGFPFGATARSFAFRKSVYREINGYRNTTETLSGDDDLFIRECVKKKFKVGYFLNENSFVYSYPSESLREYFLRKSRHLKTSHHYLLKHKVILGLWYSINLISALSIFFISISFEFILPFAIKMTFELILMNLFKKYLHHKFNSLQIIYLEIFYQLLIPVNFIGSLIIRDNWNRTRNFN